MKTNRLFIYAAALMMTAACAKEVAPETVAPEADNAPEYAVSFTAYTENAPELKAALGTSTAGKPQTFWENGDVISVYSSANMSTSARSSYLFSTSLNQNSSSATFGYNGEDFQPSGKYMAIYPHREETRVVNFTAQPFGTDPSLFPYEGDAYRMATVIIPQDQTLVAGSYDRSAAVAVAVSDGSSLHFKNATALIKFQVEDTDILSGSIKASEPITGTFRCDILASDGTPIMVTYAQPNSTYLDFTIDGTTPLSPATDYYVAVRPTTLSDGFEFYLNGVMVKKYDIEKFERSKVYDLGTLSVPEDELVPLMLTFDFTDATAMTAWPTQLDPNGDMAPSEQMPCPYVINDVSYIFISAQPSDATGRKWPFFKEETGNNRVVIPNQRFLGLPVVEGYKLTEISFVVVSGNTSVFAIYDASRGNTVCSNQSGAKGTYTFNDLRDAEQYWLKVGSKDTAISKMTLTYTPKE